MPVIFECGKWKGNPPEGTVTPRRRVGNVFDRNGDNWDIYYWQIKDKLSAAQFLVRKGLGVGRMIFFSTREEAFAWRDNPVNPTLEEIIVELEKCQWHKPSKGVIQLWLDIRRT